MKNMNLVGLSILLSMAVACAAESGPSSGNEGKETSPVNGGAADPVEPAPAPALKPAPAPAPACTPLAKSTGTANPASVYCAALGYGNAGEQCTFGDGTSCEQWSFYRGECGQAHSFCNKHGGSVANKIEDMGTWTASYAVCTLSGKQCQEDAFAHSCSCE